MSKLFPIATALALSCGAEACHNDKAVAEQYTEAREVALQRAPEEEKQHYDAAEIAALNKEIEGSIIKALGKPCSNDAAVAVFHTSLGAFSTNYDEVVGFMGTKIDGSLIGDTTNLVCQSIDSKGPATVICSMVFNQYNKDLEPVNGFSVEVVCIKREMVATPKIKQQLVKFEMAPHVDVGEAFDIPFIYSTKPTPEKQKGIDL